MTRALSNIYSTRSEDRDDDYSMDYSFAMEYSGPPVSHDIPQMVPIDIHRIPTASVAVKAVTWKNFSLPVMQPIVDSDHSKKNASGELKSVDHSATLRSSDRVYSRKLENGSYKEELGGAQSFSSSGLLRFSDSHNESDHFLGSSKESTLKSQEFFPEISSVEDIVVEASGRGNRTSTAVTFRDFPSNDDTSEGNDHDEPIISLERPVVLNDGKKGLCHRCHKRKRFEEKEVCIVCGAKYCRNCVIRAMGCMPEGRKCITCIGRQIDESRRGSLGKCSRMLRRMLVDDTVKQIMRSEISCEVNQLPPYLISVNGKALSIDELVLLQSCLNPPRKLKPGKYWYDQDSGYWGKDGEKPCQIISTQLAIGYEIRRDASNGSTNVVINNREITKAELLMLQAAGINCEGNPHFWLTADGSYQHEGMKNVMGNLWEKKIVKLVCAALSLPFPSNTINPSGEGDEKDMEIVDKKNLEQRMMNKLLLVGCDQSGTSTIFKQAKIIYNIPSLEDEKTNIKIMIQRNVYSYICILLEGHARFEEDYLIEMRRQHADEPGISGNSQQADGSCIHSFSPRLKAFSNLLLQVMASGNLEAIFPAATREYSPLIEELWKDKAFQATYKRRAELHSLPRVANHFLDRAVEITRVDYEPSRMDILYAEVTASSNGIASMEFTFPKSTQDGYMVTSDQNDPSISYQLIRLHASTLGENCKWLEMFEDTNLIIYCVSLTHYAEHFEDINGFPQNKMLAAKKLFETIITHHQTLADKHYLLILNKFDLLEEIIERVPLSQCDWFRDFNPVINVNPYSSTSNNNNPQLAQRAYHYVAVKFKRLFSSLTGKKLFVARVTALEGESVGGALGYGREILKWNDEIYSSSVNGWSTGSN